MARRFSFVAGEEPNPSRFIDPFDDVMLLEYFHDVALWHGFIRFLGLPHLQESPDQPLHELYVEPFLSEQPIHADEPPAEWLPKVEPVLEAVADSRRLVVLGDPGSGKSTLVSWIAWQLSQPQPNPWQARLGPLVPLPMVLRELKIDASLTWHGLVKAFLDHPVAAKLTKNGKRIDELAELGQAFFLLDGLDEVGNLETRTALRKSFLTGSAKFPGSRFLLTSRVVGYEALPFDQPELTSEEFYGIFSPRRRSRLGFRVRVDNAELRHVAPFSDDQIERFAQNWYSRREAAPALRETGAGELVRAIHGSESTLRLARNPNLLTLMALIHRVQRRLPHGRALLFEKIAEAYLESIDAFRGLQEVDYPFLQKKRWLAYVAFQLQLRRSEALTKKYQERELQREVLADRETVVNWIVEAMEATVRGADRKAAEKFIDYIGRRSGLLLPRGEGLFAFTHLSFQEYFAAWHLAQQIISPRWSKGRSPERTRPKDLYRYANESVWREPLILLFELLAEHPGWVEELSEKLFGEKFGELEEAMGDGSQGPRAELIAELSVDPYSGFSEEQRRQTWIACWRWEIGSQQVPQPLLIQGLGVARRLMSAERQESAGVWRAFGEVASVLKPKKLSFQRTALVDLAPLSGLSSLQTLRLGGTSVNDLAPLSGLSSLQTLNLSDTSVNDLSPLSGLSSLQTLNLSGTSVSDLAPLSGLSSLQELRLSSPSVSDLTPLSGLSSLKHLFLHRTAVSKANFAALRKALPNTEILTSS
jgi:internalin A